MVMFRLKLTINMGSTAPNIDINKAVIMDGGTWIAVCTKSTGEIWVYNRKTKMCLKTIETRDGIKHMTELDDSRVAYITDNSRTLKIWDIFQERCLHSISVSRLYKPAGIAVLNNKIVVGGFTNLIFVVNPEKEEIVEEIDVKHLPEGLTVSNNQIFFHFGKSIYCCDSSNGHVTSRVFESRVANMVALRSGHLYVGFENGKSFNIDFDTHEMKPITLTGISSLRQLKSLKYNPTEKKMITYDEASKRLSIFSECS